MNFNKLTAILFISVCLIWGTTWFAMEVAVQTIPPIFATGVRFLIASPILFLVAKLLNQPILFPRGKSAWIIVISLFYFAIPFTLMIAGEKYISSGLASIIFANMPIAVMLTSVFFLNLRVDIYQVGGLILSVFSLCTILSNELSIGGQSIMVGSSALLLAVVIHAVMYVLVQKYCQEIKVFTYNALPSFIAAGLLIFTSMLVEDVNFSFISSNSLLAVGYLGVFASVGGIVAYFRLGQISSPFVASMCFLIFPLVALSVKAFVSGESISGHSLFMLLPLLIGIFMAKFDFSALGERGSQSGFKLISASKIYIFTYLGLVFLTFYI